MLQESIQYGSLAVLQIVNKMVCVLLDGKMVCADRKIRWYVQTEKGHNSKYVENILILSIL